MYQVPCSHRQSCQIYSSRIDRIRSPASSRTAIAISACFPNQTCLGGTCGKTTRTGKRSDVSPNDLAYPDSHLPETAHTPLARAMEQNNRSDLLRCVMRKHKYLVAIRLTFTHQGADQKAGLILTGLLLGTFWTHGHYGQEQQAQPASRCRTTTIHGRGAR